MKENKGIMQWVFEIYLAITLVWILTAISFDITMVILHLMGRDDLIRLILNKIFL
jgi:hypothetical protein